MMTPRSKPLCGGDAPKPLATKAGPPGRTLWPVRGDSYGLHLGLVVLAAFLMVTAPCAAHADFVDDLGATTPPGPSPNLPKDKTLPQTPPEKATPTQPGATKDAPPLGRPADSAATPPSPQAAPKAAGQKQEPGGLLSEDVTKHDTAAPIDFKGRIMKGQRSLGRVDLEGDVVITQADARMLSDTATLLSDPESQQTRKAIARGKVRFSKQPTPAAPPLKAEAEEMEYFVQERRILMTGKPRVWRGTELIQGKEIVLDLDTGEVTIKEARGIVEPGKAATKPAAKK